jgi:carbon-monoxide dehydrogenase medium subunit
MYPFTYQRAESVAQASALLLAHDDAKPLSGGMTLIPTLKQRLAAPSHLVDLSRLPELRRLERNGDSVVIGAAMTHCEVSQSPVVRQGIPALAELAGLIGDPQVRNRGTMGGSLANNDPAADYPAAMLGLGGVVVTNQRRIGADDFFTGMFDTALQRGELIVALGYPIPQRACYVKYRHPASGYAVVGIFLAQTADGIRVAVTGAGPCVFRWREAEEALANNLSASALEQLLPEADSLLGDVHTSQVRRAHLVAVMTRRATNKLLQAAAPSDRE